MKQYFWFSLWEFSLEHLLLLGQPHHILQRHVSWPVTNFWSKYHSRRKCRISLLPSFGALIRAALHQQLDRLCTLPPPVSSYMHIQVASHQHLLEGCDCLHSTHLMSGGCLSFLTFSSLPKKKCGGCGTCSGWTRGTAARRGKGSSSGSGSEVRRWAERGQALEDAEVAAVQRVKKSLLVEIEKCPVDRGAARRKKHGFVGKNNLNWFGEACVALLVANVREELVHVMWWVAESAAIAVDLVVFRVRCDYLKELEIVGEERREVKERRRADFVCVKERAEVLELVLKKRRSKAKPK